MKAVREKGQLWGKLYIYDIEKMDEAKRKRIAKWIREQAVTLLKEHGTLAGQYRARYWK